MTTETPPMIMHHGQSLQPQERFKHRAWIGVRVEALLYSYWDKRPTDVVRAEMMRDWIDALEMFTEGELRKACQDYLSGINRDVKPKPGSIRELIMKERGRLYSRWKDEHEIEYEAPRERTQEQREAIAGLVRQFGGGK